MNQKYNSEQLIYSESCRSSLFFFWLPTRFNITNKRLVVESKNNILGLPIGSRSQNISYRNISSVESSSKVHIFRLIIGLWLFTSSFRLLMSADFMVIGIAELILGVLLLIHCYKSKLKIVNNSGQSNDIDVPFIESGKIRRISKEVNEQLIKYY